MIPFTWSAMVKGRRSLNASPSVGKYEGGFDLRPMAHEGEHSPELLLQVLDVVDGEGGIPPILDELAIAIVRQNPPQMAPMGADGGGS